MFDRISTENIAFEFHEIARAISKIASVNKVETFVNQERNSYFKIIAYFKNAKMLSIIIGNSKKGLTKDHTWRPTKIEGVN